MKVLVFGTFDRLHPGHKFLLSEASNRGDVFVVVARNSTVERIKGRQPELDEDERIATIQTAFPNATVMLGNPVDYMAPIRKLKPDLILLGYDQQLPPGIAMEDLPAPVERLTPYHPDKYKSSLRRKVPE